MLCYQLYAQYMYETKAQEGDLQELFVMLLCEAMIKTELHEVRVHALT